MQRCLLVRVLAGSLVIASASLLAPAVAAQDGCLEFVPPLLFNTSSAGDDPWVQRTMYSQIFQWGTHRMLMHSVGNELEVMTLDNPLSPGSGVESHFQVPPFGDRDYNLFNFAICDDCRYGLAGFQSVGTVLFDLGTGITHLFVANAHERYTTASNMGGFTFKHGAQQYLVANNLLGTCGGGEVLLFNGTSPEQLTLLHCLQDATGGPVGADGGIYIPGSPAYVYIVSGTRAYTFRVSGTGNGLSLAYRGQFIRAGWVRAPGLDADLDAPQPFPRLLVATNPNHSEIYDLEDPDQPVLLAEFNPHPSIDMDSVAVEFPFLWLGSFGGQTENMTHTYDISDPSNPVPLDHGFWSTSNEWNAFGYAGNMGGDFTADGEYFFLSRWSVLERFEFSACGSVAPVAHLSVGPSPAFPGDQVTVSNTSAGAYTLSAVWVEDEAGEIVAGSGTMSSTTPSSRPFTVPADLAKNDSYTAWVAVASDDYPCNDPVNYPELCGDRVTSSALAVDRAPEASITVTPAVLITGDTASLSSSGTEGHPTGYLWEVLLDGATPPAGQPPDPTLPGLSYELSESGTWTFNLRADYAHQVAGGGLYSDTATLSRAVSSVAADFAVAPASPLSTQHVYFCSDSEYSPDIAPAGLSYVWRLCEDSACTSLVQEFTGCSDGYSACGTRCGVQVSEAYFPDETRTYYATLTLTNDDAQHGGHGDVSVAPTRSFVVTNGAFNPTFAWSPSSPSIGENVSFVITGAASVDSVDWNFGGAGCSGFSQTVTCTPTFSNCLTQVHEYASAGAKTVSMTVHLGAQTVGPITRQLTVQNSGQCPGTTCSYTISPSSASVVAAGGNGSFSVDASASSCQWTAVSNATWLHVTGGSTGIGDGTVSYSVDANSGGARSGTITAANRNFTVSQASGVAAQVNFTISDSTPDIGQTVVFTANSDCANPTAWNLGAVNCDGASPAISCPNPALCRVVQWAYAAAAVRTVTLTCAEGSKQNVVTVNQSGSCPSTCDKDGPPDASFTMTAKGAPVTEVLVGESVTFTDTSTKALDKAILANFTWSPVSPGIGESVVFTVSGAPDTSATEWDFGAPGCSGFAQQQSCTPSAWNCLTRLFKYSVAGSFTVSLRVDGGSPITKTITVEDTGVCDGGTTCSYTLNPTSTEVPAAGGSGSVAVSTQADCDWTATANAAWLHVTAGATGSGSGTVQYSADANGSSSSRNGTLRIAGQYFYVTQAGTGGGGGGDTAPTAWAWTVKLDNQTVATSTLASFSYQFTTPGSYTIRLQSSNCAGADATTQTLLVYEEVVPEEFIVPAVDHAPGINDTAWRSDLRIFNPGSELIDATIAYRPRGASDITVRRTAHLPPNGTVVFDDVTTVFNLPGDSQQGSLWITFEGGDGTTPVVASRTYNDTPAGTYGQYVPAVPVMQPEGGSIYLTGLVDNTDYRTNLLLANLSGEALGGIVVRVLDEYGAVVGTFEAGIAANTSNLLVNIAGLAGVTQDLDLFSLEVVIGDAPVAASASVIDNATGDPVMYSPDLAAEGRIRLPGVAHLPGSLGSQWRSDLTLLNPTAGDVTVMVEYTPDVALPLDYSLEVDLAPGRAWMVRDVLELLIGASANTKGYLTIYDKHDGAPPLVVGRTYNQAEGGTFGQNLEAFGEPDLIAAGSTRYIPGAATGDPDGDGPRIASRTNLGLVNTSGSTAAAVDVFLYDGDGELIAQIPGYALAPGQFAQFDPFQATGLDDFAGYASLALHVASGGPVAAYASVVDNGTQDPILIPALMSY